METWKRTVYISLICVFCTSFGVSQLAPILPLYFHDLGVQTPSAMSLWSGLATGATYLIVCLVAPFWGRVADKKGRKITLIRSSFGMALCNLLLAFQTTPEGVVIIRLIQGLVSGFYSATITLIANWLGTWPISFGQSSGFSNRPFIRWIYCRYYRYSQ